jgi:hypothetical protein
MGEFTEYDGICIIIRAFEEKDKRAADPPAGELQSRS